MEWWGHSGMFGEQTLWTPAQITTALWLDAADAATITTVSDAVSQWNDKSGNGRNVSQGTAANRPTVVTSLNGLNGLSFDGSNDALINTATGITSGSYSGAFNVFYVATRTSSSGGTILTERASTLVACSQFLVETGTYYISSDGLNATSNHTIAQATYNQLSTSGAIVAHGHLAGSRDTLWVNGTAETVTAGTASSITGSAGFRIGEREVGVQRWGGTINEVVVTTATLTTATRQYLEGYFAHRWGLTANLPAGHPYKTSPPYV